MFLLQDNNSSETYATGYKMGYEVGKWMAQNPTLTLLIGVVFAVGFVWILTKVVKQIRTFGE